MPAIEHDPPGEDGGTTRPDACPGARLHVSLVIPTYNGRHLLEPCLDSIARQTRRPDETIAVDDGSSDGTPAFLRERYPWVRVVVLARNQGFVGAVNAGIVAAGGDVIALLNNDTEAEPAWLEALVALEQDPTIAFCDAKLLLFDRRDHLHAAGDGYTVGGVPVNRAPGRAMTGGTTGREPVLGVRRRAAYRAESGGSAADPWLIAYLTRT